jgi:hypothetical protein
MEVGTWDELMGYMTEYFKDSTIALSWSKAPQEWLDGMTPIDAWNDSTDLYAKRQEIRRFAQSLASPEGWFESIKKMSTKNPA